MKSLSKQTQQHEWMRLTCSPTNVSDDIRGTCGWLLTKMPFEILDLYSVAQGHYNGAIVQA